MRVRAKAEAASLHVVNKGLRQDVERVSICHLPDTRMMFTCVPMTAQTICCEARKCTSAGHWGCRDTLWGVCRGGCLVKDWPAGKSRGRMLPNKSRQMVV